MNCCMAEKIRQLRKGLKLSQEEFGKSLGVSNRAVSKWEKGKSNPGINTLSKITKLYNISVEALMNEDGDIVLPENEIKREKSNSMPSIRDIYKIGRGPSSSHTMAVEKVCKIFRKKYREADSFKIILFGSLAKNGRGSLTDAVIKKTFPDVHVEIEFNTEKERLPHPNTMELYAYCLERKIGFLRAFSTGGGNIKGENVSLEKIKEVYPFKTFNRLSEYCKKNNKKIWQVVEEFEGKELWDYLLKVWETMKGTIKKGLENEGTLPGGLEVKRKAKLLYNQRHIDESSETKENRIVCAYAFATSEQNANGSVVVTAPTCGASGVLPAVLLYEQETRGLSDNEILKALATAGIIGNIIKTNASISGAECGCQAEIGTACSMAAGALAQIFNLDIDQIEYAAEVAMEHHLGLTCDPIKELVQIPCIERNAVAAMRAINSVSLASFLSDTRKISFDLVIETMYETGKDMLRSYRETSEGGLAKLYR